MGFREALFSATQEEGRLHTAGGATMTRARITGLSGPASGWQWRRAANGEI